MRRASTSRLIRSPVWTMASGPPMADSGVMWRTMVPKAVPHPGVGDADHVFDSLARETEGDGQIAGLRHAGCAFGAGIAEDEDIVGGDIEIGEVNACGHVLDRVEDDGAACVAEKAGRGG